VVAIELEKLAITGTIDTGNGPDGMSWAYMRWRPGFDMR
jgi:hypothetical protein